MRLIDADALRQRMYHEAFETDTDMQKWDSGCWIRYKLFENCIESATTISPDEVRGVVHCKDCKWCHAGYCEKYDDLIPWGCANKPWEDWFCADGAKMEVSEDA